MAAINSIQVLLNSITDPSTTEVSSLHLQEMFSLLHPTHNLSSQHFNDAIRTISGENKSSSEEYWCHVNDLKDVVKELNRRIELREKLYWDFRLLDVQNEGSISLEKARVMFKEVQGDEFESFWKLFEEQQIVPKNEVYFEEIELFLCQVHCSLLSRD